MAVSLREIFHDAPAVRQSRRDSVVLLAVHLLGEPEDDIGLPVADVAADQESPLWWWGLRSNGGAA